MSVNDDGDESWPQIDDAGSRLLGTEIVCFSIDNFDGKAAQTHECRDETSPDRIFHRGQTRSKRLVQAHSAARIDEHEIQLFRAHVASLSTRALWSGIGSPMVDATMNCGRSRTSLYIRIT